MAILLMFLIIQDYAIGTYLRQHLQEREIEHSNIELGLIGSVTLDSLLKRDYVSAARLIEYWGSQHKDIVSLKAISANGFVLADYERTGESKGVPFELSRAIYQGDRLLVTFHMTGDSKHIEEIISTSTNSIIIASIIFMVGLGFTLWTTQKKMALAPLEQEISRRERAEADLLNARDRLERDVQERTEELRLELKERHRIEEALISREEDIRLLLNSTAEAIYGIDTDGLCTFSNPACVKVLGYASEDDFLGTHMHNLIHHTRADGTDYPADECKVCDAFRKGDGVHIDDEVLWRSDGTSFPVEYWSFPIIKNNEIIGAVVTFLDITRRKQAERQREELTRTLNTLLEHMPEGVFLLDSNLRIALANPVAKEFLHELAGAKEGDMLHEISGKRPVNLLISPPQILWHDIEHAGKIFETAGRSLADGGIVFVMRDVTSDRETQKRLRMQERLSAVGQLAAGIAHDFNNILTVINGYAEITLSEGGLSDDTTRALDAILKSGQRAEGLIHQILDFSRQSISEMKPINLLHFIEEFNLFIRRTLPETISIKFESDPGDYVVDGDPSKLQQVFANLAVNARDAMQDGGIMRIALSIKNFTDTSSTPPMQELLGLSWALISFEDTGTGISDQILPHVFEPFYTTKDSGEGTGLGLPQVYGLIKQHGGHVKVTTSEAGTTFDVYLPLSTQQELSSPPETTTRPETAGKGQTVLVAEDESSVRGLLVNMLTSLDYKVIQGANGKEALKAYDESPQDIVLAITDIVMPEMNGIELAAQLRNRSKNLAIIAISGYAPGLNDKEFNEAGIDEFVNKPFKLSELTAAISRVTHKRETQQ